MSVQTTSVDFTVPVSLNLESVPLIEDWVYCRASYTHSGVEHYFTTITTEKRLEAFLASPALSFRTLSMPAMPNKTNPLLVNAQSQLALQFKGFGHWDTIPDLIWLRQGASDSQAYQEFDKVVAFLAAHSDARILFGCHANHRIFSRSGEPLKLGLLMDSSCLLHDLNLDLSATANAMAQSGEFYPVCSDASVMGMPVSAGQLIRTIPHYNRSSYLLTDLADEILALKGFMKPDRSEITEDNEDSFTIDNCLYLSFIYWPSDAAWEKLSQDTLEATPNSLAQEAIRLGLFPLVSYQGYI